MTESEKYQKLLAFVKEAAHGEEYLNSLCVKYRFSELISHPASDLLKEIGEE